MAHPLSAWYDVPHGVACVTQLPTVMNYNKEYNGEKCRSIVNVLGVENALTLSLEDVRDAAVSAVRQLDKDALNDICTGGNSRDMNLDEIIELYKQTL